MLYINSLLLMINWNCSHALSQAVIRAALTKMDFAFARPSVGESRELWEQVKWNIPKSRWAKVRCVRLMHLRFLLLKPVFVVSLGDIYFEVAKNLYIQLK